MNLAIIGAGLTGRTLGKQWAAKGNQLWFGGSDEDRARLQQTVEDAWPNARAVTVRAATEACDVVVLAVPWKHADTCLEGAADLTGKILVDTITPVTWVDGPQPAGEGSFAETLARRYPGARVVKAFNTLAARHLMNVRFGNQDADTFLCADDLDALGVVRTLAEQIGFRAVNAGPLHNAVLVEHLSVLFFYLGTRDPKAVQSVSSMIGNGKKSGGRLPPA
ncbi:MAG: NAD(P)-binding domain-containing protein [Pseudomonadota bacterium]